MKQVAMIFLTPENRPLRFEETGNGLKEPGEIRKMPKAEGVGEKASTADCTEGSTVTMKEV